MKSKVFIGTSGWSFAHWKENFYPEGLKPAMWLHHFSEHFGTVEVNTTFYHSPLKTTILNWHKQVPATFIFSIKASRYITHQKRLHDCRENVDFLYKNLKDLKKKLGPILFQLPPSFQANHELLAEFISNLNPKQKHVFEFRHKTWYCEETYELLRKHNIALCITDLNGKQSPEVITANFTYLRLHGPRKSYTGSYGLARLKKLKGKIDTWMQTNVAVYCYFDNDEKGYAIKDAELIKTLF